MLGVKEISLNYTEMPFRSCLDEEPAVDSAPSQQRPCLPCPTTRHLQINASGYHTSTVAAPIEIHIFFSRSRLYLVPEGPQAQNPGLCRVLHSGVD
jgi:hypothetical protein